MFRVKSDRPVEVQGAARISADNLGEPIHVPVHLHVDLTDQTIGYYEARELRNNLLDLG